MSTPFSSGPPRPRPGFAPPSPATDASQPTPNLADSFQNLQINRPSPPSAAVAPRPGAPPASLASRPGPPPPFASRPPPQAAVAAAPMQGGPIISNGPRSAPVPSSASSAMPAPPPGAVPSSVRAPPNFVQAQGVRPPPGGLPTALPINPQSLQPLSRPPPATQPFTGVPPTQTQFSGPPTSQPFSGMTPSSRAYAPPPSSQPYGSPPSSQPLGAPPTSQPFGVPQASQPYMGPPVSQTFGASPLSPPLFGQPPSQQFSTPPTPGALFGAQPWQSQPRQVTPPMHGSMQAPPRMYGMPPSFSSQTMPPVPPVMGQAALVGSQVSTPSKIDPNQIPRPMPSSSVLVFETRQGNQANNPPPATSDFVVKDNGNCSPRLMRCTMNQIPCSGDLLTMSSMPLAVMVQPLALPHPSEEPIQVVDFGESGPIRCSRCKGYLNPFMRFIDQGRQFICNLCGFTNDTPRDYYCHLGPDGRRRDADERPELCRGTVEFVATKEYMVRDPMPAVFFFLVDVSMNAIQTGATAAACSAIGQALTDLPEGPQTFVGFATFDSTIHFYNLKRASQQPLMLIVPDIQDVYTPLHTDIIVRLSECHQSLEQLLDNIPSMFESNKVAESAFGAAIKAGFLAMKSTGGKLLVFQSVLPSVGLGSLSSREADGRNISTGDKEAHKLLQPADKTLKTMAIEFAEYQVCVDVFLTTQTFVDIASISVIPSTTGGQVYYYYPFSAISDPTKLYNDLRWNISRPQGFEAVMRVRCSQGLQVQEYSGSFCKRIPTDIDLPAIDCDKTIMVTFKHDDKFQENSECGFQCALLYTTIFGQRRIRVLNLSLPCTSTLSVLFRSADLDSQFACFLKQAANGIPVNPLSQVCEQITNLCINILHSYRKYCATVSAAGQLILPEALKLLPLYTIALAKSIGLRNDGRLDDRCYWVARATSLSIPHAIPLVYPRMISLHDLASKEEDGSLLSSTIPLSSEHISDDGVYLLENGEDALIYMGNMVNQETVQQLFGVSSVDAIPSQLVLQQLDNDLSKKLNILVNEIRQQRCSYLRLRLCKKGDPSGMFFLSYMIEDKVPGGLSYVEFLVHVHRQIQSKMA